MTGAGTSTSCTSRGSSCGPSDTRRVAEPAGQDAGVGDGRRVRAESCPDLHVGCGAESAGFDCAPCHASEHEHGVSVRVVAACGVLRRSGRVSSGVHRRRGFASRRADRGRGLRRHGMEARACRPDAPRPGAARIPRARVGGATGRRRGLRIGRPGSWRTGASRPRRMRTGPPRIGMSAGPPSGTRSRGPAGPATRVGGVRVRAAGQIAEVVDPAEEHHTIGVQAERGASRCMRMATPRQWAARFRSNMAYDSTRSLRNSG